MSTHLADPGGPDHDLTRMPAQVLNCRNGHQFPPLLSWPWESWREYGRDVEKAVIECERCGLPRHVTIDSNTGEILSSWYDYAAVPDYCDTARYGPGRIGRNEVRVEAVRRLHQTRPSERKVIE